MKTLTVVVLVGSLLAVGLAFPLREDKGEARNPALKEISDFQAGDRRARYFSGLKLIDDNESGIWRKKPGRHFVFVIRCV